MMPWWFLEYEQGRRDTLRVLKKELASYKWKIKHVIKHRYGSQKKLGSTREEAFKAFAVEIRGDGSSPKFSVIASEYARALDARVKSGQT